MCEIRQNTSDSKNQLQVQYIIYKISGIKIENNRIVYYISKHD